MKQQWLIDILGPMLVVIGLVALAMIELALWTAGAG